MFYVDLDMTAMVMNLLLPVANERAPFDTSMMMA